MHIPAVRRDSAARILLFFRLHPLCSSFVLSVLLWVLVFADGRTAQAMAKRSHPPAYREITLTEMMEREFGVNIPILIRIPTAFGLYPSIYPGHHRAEARWGFDRENWLKERPRNSGLPLHLMIEWSPLIRYDAPRGLFTYYKEIDETNLSDYLTATGTGSARVERYNLAGYPVLFVEYPTGSRGWVREVHIATKVRGEVIMITLYGDEAPPGKEEVWEVFKQSLLRGRLDN